MTDTDPGAAPTVRSDVRHMLGGYRAAATATAALAAAELQLAASTAVLLLALAIAIALLVVTAWILGMLAIAALVAGAADWPLALSLVAGANLLGAAGAGLWMRAVVPNLTFRELRNLLGNRDAAAPAEEPEQ